MNDNEFARHATEALGFKVNGNHVSIRRAEFQIKSNIIRRTSTTLESTDDVRMTYLESRVSALENFVKTLQFEMAK